MKKFLLLGMFVLGAFVAKSQDLDLANQYFKQGEYQKAKDLFQKVAKDKNNARVIHENYLSCLYKLKDFEEADKFLKKQIKNNEEVISYRADEATLLEMRGNAEEAKKKNEEVINIAAKTEASVNELQEYYFKNGKTDLIIQLLKRGREISKDETKYAVFLARAYAYNGQKDLLIDEVLKYGLKENNQDYAKATLQDNLKDDKEIEMLEKALYSKVQKFPNEEYYADLLIWHLVQQKEFYKAFVQSRAIDRRYKLEGQKVFELAGTTFQNKDFRNASLMYEYITKEYPNGEFYPYARRWMIQCKEEIVKTTYPVQKEDIKSLIGDYQKMFSEVGRTPKTMDGMRNTALLYAFYLNDKDRAVAILDSAITLSAQNQDFKDRSKLDLGDIYILRNEPWEATLLYSQVEKSQKEELLGQDAKLRNAKLHYYNGEFDLAKDILDILKKATTREIANDAMQLSLLIQDNTGMDTTETAMREYAAVDLLIFQNKNDEAIKGLGILYEKYKAHSLADEILWLRANTYLKINEPQKALADLDLLLKNYGTDILADDALFLEAKIYQDNLGQKEKAMELYKELLQKYSGSIYGAEARKRFRNLRGDTIN